MRFLKYAAVAAFLSNLLAPSVWAGPEPANPAAGKEREVVYFSQTQGERQVLTRLSVETGKLAYLSASRQAWMRAMPNGEKHSDLLPAASSDGKRLAFYSNRSGALNVWIMSADGSGLKSLTQSETDLLPSQELGRGKIGFSPDGNYLAWIAKGQVWVTDLRSGLAQNLNSDRDVSALGWTRNSKGIAYLKQGSLRLARIKSPLKLTLVERGVNSPEIFPSPKDDLKLFFFRNGAFRIDTRARTQQRIMGSMTQPNSMALSPDGSNIALLGESPDHRVEAFLCPSDGKAGQPVQVTRGGAESCLFSSDGKRLLFQRDGMLWEIAASAGSEGVRPLTHFRVLHPVVSKSTLSEESL